MSRSVDLPVPVHIPIMGMGHLSIWKYIWLHQNPIITFYFGLGISCNPQLYRYGKRTYEAPCVVLVIDDNPYGLMVALSYVCRTCP
jgi:hypothetical protein